MSPCEPGCIWQAPHGGNCRLPVDPVHPPHYTALSIQPIEVIESWGLNFNLGTVAKYLGRAGRKGDALTDLKKCRFYLEREIANLEARQ